MINPDLLFDYGAIRKRFRKNDVIFDEGQPAFYYFQILEGMVKMVNVGDEHDFIQGIFTDGDSFGEPPLLCGGQYPSAAIAITDTTLAALPLKHLTELLRHNFEIHMDLTRHICRRIAYKAMLLKKINLEEPEVRILTVIDLLKEKLPRDRHGLNGHFIVPLTRQDLADLTGLRVETVIRKVIRLEEQGHLCISDRKILRAYNATN